MSSIIETQGLSKQFKSRKSIVDAVRGIDMTVEAGEIFGFLGPNGAGKTTTLRMLATLLEPDGGTAKVAGFDLRREPARVRERIGYVSQTGGADASSTARENLVLQGRLYGMNKADAQRRAAELIAALEMDSFADRLSKTYSGGQRRRLDLGTGMIHKPSLLFLDEPTTGLDPQSRARLWDEVRRLRESGTTIFITTHYLEEADALCDRLAIMDDGRLVGEGTPDALKRQIAGDVLTVGLDVRNGSLKKAEDLLRAQSFVRELHSIGENGDSKLQLYVEGGEETLPVVLRLMDGASLPIRTVSMARPTLDDVFLRLTGRSLRESSN